MATRRRRAGRCFQRTPGRVTRLTFPNHWIALCGPCGGCERPSATQIYLSGGGGLGVHFGVPVLPPGRYQPGEGHSPFFCSRIFQFHAINNYSVTEPCLARSPGLAEDAFTRISWEEN